MPEIGMAGFKSRPVVDDDPLVCGCGVTLGTQALNKPENAEKLKAVMAEHQTEHVRRLAHQAKHRVLDGACEDCDV